MRIIAIFNVYIVKCIQMYIIARFMWNIVCYQRMHSLTRAYQSLSKRLQVNSLPSLITVVIILTSGVVQTLLPSE